MPKAPVTKGKNSKKSDTLIPKAIGKKTATKSKQKKLTKTIEVLAAKGAIPTTNEIPTKEVRKLVVKEHIEKINAFMGKNNTDLKFKFYKRIHASTLYRRKTTKVVEPRKMQTEELVVRHISTMLLTRNPKFVEVQTAISHTTKSFYISSNSKNNALRSLLLHVKTLQDMNALCQTTGLADRELRHVKNLILEIQQNIYPAYKIVHVEGYDSQHAETKIVTYLKNNNIDWNFISGTRRPCTACAAFFNEEGVDPNRYNRHTGSLWLSQAAFLSLAGVKEDKIIAFLAADPGISYINKGLAVSRMDDYNTDSEGEEEEEEEEMEE